MKQDNFFYLYMQRILLDVSDPNKKIKYGDAKKKLARFRFKRKFVPIIFREMEAMDLLKKIDKRNLEIINCERCNCINVD